MNVKVEVVEVVSLCYFVKKDRKNNNLNFLILTSVTVQANILLDSKKKSRTLF